MGEVGEAGVSIRDSEDLLGPQWHQGISQDLTLSKEPGGKEVHMHVVCGTSKCFDISKTACACSSGNTVQPL